MARSRPRGTPSSGLTAPRTWPKGEFAVARRNRSESCGGALDHLTVQVLLVGEVITHRDPAQTDASTDALIGGSAEPVAGKDFPRGIDDAVAGDRHVHLGAAAPGAGKRYRHSAILPGHRCATPGTGEHLSELLPGGSSVHDGLRLHNWIDAAAAPMWPEPRAGYTRRGPSPLVAAWTATL